MKAHQRIIREKESSNTKGQLSLIPTQPKHADIKTAEVREISYQQAKKIILKYE